jgi:hypothetical protein
MEFVNKLKAVLAFAACLLVIGSGGVQAQNVVNVRNDGGGVVNEYVIKANLAVLRGDNIRISGWCASACTAYLGNPKTCVTQNARFGFHGPSGGTPAENRKAAEMLASHLPYPLQNWYLTKAVKLRGQSYIALSAAQLVEVGAARWC